MDGENNGKPYEQMDDLGVFPYFWVDTHIAFKRVIESLRPLYKNQNNPMTLSNPQTQLTLRR